MRTNVLKNRDISNDTVINRNVTMELILKGGPEDTGRFNVNDNVSVTGYVLGAEDAGPESCNCFNDSASKQNIMIWLGQSIESWKDSVFVVEITPKYKKLHPEVDADRLIGKKITVTGNMLYNFEEMKKALNACKTCKATNRKTAWEICPVAKVEIIPPPIK